jgi:transcriptional regulator with XRE-family HTH domain
MKNSKPRRATSQASPPQRAKLRRLRTRVALELPDLAARNRMRKEAGDEPTLSGELRRAVHSSPLSLADIAEQAGITPLVLDEFLTGERTLRSDVLDRLAKGLGFALGART